MNPERYHRLKEIIHTAERLPEEQREAYLEEACGGDAELRAEADAIRCQDSATLQVLRTRGLASLLDGVVADRHASTLPEHIGPYRILGVLGEGGMGVVYRAEQTEPIRREVALDLVRRGFDSRRVFSRFESERQALALMEHPNIARVLDAGSDDAGKPYFVMELVRGAPITEHCRTNDLSIRTRIELLSIICRGVQHAHWKGIIHRDLKPSNLLVTTHEGEPLPKIIDFGIAKAIGPEVEEARVTRDGQMVGTLEYMSPEQAGGDSSEINTRSDVYSLGVILYELLTDKLPHDVRGLPLGKALHVITEDPPEPIRRASTRTRRIDADIETIVFKALEKEPDRRYGSPADLADDIDRFLRCEPIRARTPSATYQLRKLVARHKAPFAFAATLFVLLAVSAVVLSVQLQAQRRERARAEGEALKATRTSEFLQEMLSSADPGEKGRDVTVLEVLDEAAARVGVGLKEPEVRAAVHRTMGVTYKTLGQFESGERHLRTALEIQKDLFGSGHREVLVTQGELASALTVQERYADAETLLLEVMAEGQAAMDEDLGLTANIVYGLALALWGQAEYSRSEEYSRRAMTLCQAAEHPDSSLIAAIFGNLSAVLRKQGKHEEAESCVREALAIRRRVLGRDHPDVAYSLNDLGLLLKKRGELAGAESLYREALEMRVRLLGEHHRDVAMSTYNLAIVLRNQGKYRQADSLYQQTAEILRRLYGETHPRFAQTLYSRASLHLALGDLEQGERLARQAMSAYRQHHGEEHVTVARCLHRIACFRQERGDPEGAEEHFRRALAMHRKTSGPSHPQVATTLDGLSVLLMGMNRAIEAETLLRESLAIREQDRGEGHWEAEVTRNRLGQCLVALGRYEDAESLLVRSHQIVQESPAVPEDVRATATEALLGVYEKLGREEKARALRAEVRM